MKCQDYNPTWKGYLLRLQQEAPKPKPVVCRRQQISVSKPHFYGEEYHGSLSREEGDSLCPEEGNFLIRESQTERGRFTLVLRVLNMVKNFKLYYEDGKHFVGDKRFDSVYALAEDGLITMYVESKAQDYIEKMSLEPVYNSLSRYSSIGSRHGNTNGHFAHRQQFHHSTPSPTELVCYDKNHQQYPLEYYGDDLSDVSPPHFQDRSLSHNDAEERLYQRGHVPQNNPDVPYHVSERDLFEQTESGQFNLSLPEASMRRLDGGMKKNLTPTSSDERRTKKRIATANHVFNQRNDFHESNLLEQEELLQELAAAAPDFSSSFNNGKSRRASHDHYGLHRNDQKLANDAMSRRFSSDVVPGFSFKQSAYHRPTVAQKQLSAVAHVRNLNSGIGVGMNSKVNNFSGKLDNPNSFNDDQRFRQEEQQSSPFSNILPAVAEGSSLDHLMAVHRQLEEGTRNNNITRNVIDDARSHSFHIRQQSDPVQPLYSRESSYDGQDPTSCRLNRISSERLLRHNKLSNKSQLTAHRTGSVGSCESGLSNGSSGVERADTSSSNFTHDSSHFSSEEDRNSPSPGQHRPAFQRCANESPQLYRFPAQIQENRIGRLPERIEESPWQRRSDVEENFSRSRSSSSKGKREPLSLLNSNKEATSNAEKSTTKNHSQAQAQCENREREVSIDKSACTGKATRPVPPTVLPKPNFKVDSSPQQSPKSKEKVHKAKTSNNSSEIKEQRKAKQLARRATTTEIATKSGGTPRRSGSLKEKSNKEKQAEETKQKAKNSSPTKDKKSSVVLSPSTRHRPVASPSRGHRQPSSSPSKSGRSKCCVAQHYEKEHHYKSHTYRGLQWCEYCGNFMWGIIQQGVQCIDCGLNVHKQCSKLVPNNCQPALKHVKHVFGVDLTTLVKVHSTERPIVVDMCLEEIEKRGMSQEGIYRVSGFHDNILELKAAFDRDGPNTDLSKHIDINTIAGALKLYLRELPIPLIPYQLYSRFINAAKISHDDGKVNAIRMGLSAMPGAHLQALKHLILHLGRVSDNSLHNQMTVHNLGVVFGPTLLRTPEKEASTQYNMNDTHFQQDVVATLIEFRQYLFGSG